MALEAIETASIDELQNLQLERMQWSLQHAYNNVPFYKKSFDVNGIRPEDRKQLSDLSRFPFTGKTDLRDNYPFGMFATSMEKVVRIHASSGTTGKPTVVAYSQQVQLLRDFDPATGEVLPYGEDGELAPHYLIVVQRQGNLDQLHVNVELAPHATETDLDAASRELQHKIKTFIGVSARVNIGDSGSITRSEGKAQRVVDHRKDQK